MSKHWFRKTGLSLFFNFNFLLKKIVKILRKKKEYKNLNIKNVNKYLIQNFIFKMNYTIYIILYIVCTFVCKNNLDINENKLYNDLVDKKCDM